MTEDRLLELVGHWQEFLGLGEWTISVDFVTPAEDDEEACVLWRAHYDEATMRLEPNWMLWDEARANGVIAHELIHLLLRDLRMAWHSVQQHVKPGAWLALADRYEHEFEGAIDRLALKFVELANS